MSESMQVIQRKMKSAKDLRSVVRTMKAMAASSISQYEQAIESLDDYYRTVQLGLAAYLLNQSHPNLMQQDNYLTLPSATNVNGNRLPVGVIIFGSDQGLVGQFNDVLFDYARHKLDKHLGNTVFWPVGERMQSRLDEKNYVSKRGFSLPRSINSVTLLVTELLVEIEASRQNGKIEDVYLFFNSPTSKAGYSSNSHSLLPLDNQWQKQAATKWPGNALPQLINPPKQSLITLLHEYLFVSMFKACTASLASENASRLNAMQRAEKNIEELQKDLNHNYHQQRQQTVDEELFDLVGGFEITEI